MPREVVVEDSDGATWLTIHNPPDNLLAPDITLELVARLREADARDDVRAIVLSGAGTTFCGGVDVAAVRAGGDPVEFGRTLVEVLGLIPRLGKPVIGAINGDALAAGFALAILTDWSVTVPDASLGTYEARIGLWPMIAQVPAVHRLLPRTALSNILTGEPFSASEALSLGIVNAVVPAERVRSEINQMLPRVTAASPHALSRGRRAFYRYATSTYDEALEDSLREFAGMFADAKQ
jgi:enoyl-CoA hydratase/carnithine racemase